MENMSLVPERAVPRTLEEVRQGLPAAVQTALERRWYADFDITRYPDSNITFVDRGDIKSDSRFMQIHQVIYGQADSSAPGAVQIGRQMQNIQNVIGSLRDGSHGLVYALCSTRKSLRLLAGVRKYELRSSVASSDLIDVLSRSMRANYPGMMLKDPASRKTAPGNLAHEVISMINLCSGPSTR